MSWRPYLPKLKKAASALNSPASERLTDSGVNELIKSQDANAPTFDKVACAKLRKLLKRHKIGEENDAQAEHLYDLLVPDFPDVEIDTGGNLRLCTQPKIYLTGKPELTPDLLGIGHG